MHDSTVSQLGGIYAKLEEVYNLTGAMCVADSAFNGRRPYIVKTGQNTMEQGNEVKREDTALRHSAECGMRAISASFPRLNDKM